MKITKRQLRMIIESSFKDEKGLTKDYPVIDDVELSNDSNLEDIVIGDNFEENPDTKQGVSRRSFIKGGVAVLVGLIGTFMVNKLGLSSASPQVRMIDDLVAKAIASGDEYYIDAVERLNNIIGRDLEMHIGETYTVFQDPSDSAVERHGMTFKPTRFNNEDVGAIAMLINNHVGDSFPDWNEDYVAAEFLVYDAAIENAKSVVLVDIEWYPTVDNDPHGWYIDRIEGVIGKIGEVHGVNSESYSGSFNTARSKGIDTAGKGFFLKK